MGRIVSICQNCDQCPVVEFTDDAVLVGEAGNLCKLKPEEWASLRKKVLSGEL